MNAHPDHPVRQQPRFIMLRALGRGPGTDDHSFGVKIGSAKGDGGFFWRKPTWHYGPTALIALDTALAYLVAAALHE